MQSRVFRLQWCVVGKCVFDFSCRSGSTICCWEERATAVSCRERGMFLSGFHTWFFSWRWEICKCVQQADGCVGASTNNFDICKDKKHQFQLSYIKPIIMLYFNCYCVVPHCSCWGIYFQISCGGRKYQCSLSVSAETLFIVSSCSQAHPLGILIVWEFTIRVSCWIPPLALTHPQTWHETLMVKALGLLQPHLYCPCCIIVTKCDQRMLPNRFSWKSNEVLISISSEDLFGYIPGISTTTIMCKIKTNKKPQ